MNTVLLVEGKKQISDFKVSGVLLGCKKGIDDDCGRGYDCFHVSCLVTCASTEFCAMCIDFFTSALLIPQTLFE